MALVPSLLWVAIGVAPIVTLFFYGFFTLGTCMLMDPFDTESGFDTDSFLSSTMMATQSIETNVPLGRSGWCPNLASAGDAGTFVGSNQGLKGDLSMQGSRQLNGEPHGSSKQRRGKGKSK